MINDGNIRRTYPALHMRPVNEAGAMSIWMSGSTRPVVQGIYDCRFRNTEPNILRLHWSGACFQHDGQRVDCRTLLAWRGVLA